MYTHINCNVSGLKDEVQSMKEALQGDIDKCTQVASACMTELNGGLNSSQSALQLNIDNNAL